LRHGVLGQETAGPGGFLMACHSMPVLLEIARPLERVAPDAWIVNYTNPTSVVTDAVLRHSGARIVGLCDQHVGDQALWAGLLGWPAPSRWPSGSSRMGSAPTASTCRSSSASPDKVPRSWLPQRLESGTRGCSTNASASRRGARQGWFLPGVKLA
jgi:Family 4 glycosyl hydrolase